MKKIFAILLIFILAFSLVACAKEDERTWEEITESMEPTLGAGYDNPETSIDLDFTYLPLPDGFETVPYNECGIAINEPYVFSIYNENHPYMFDYDTIYFQSNGSADVYLSDVYLYRTMGGVFQYGDGVIFNMVTGDMIYVKSEDEIVVSKNGVDYVGKRMDFKGMNHVAPSCDDKYICINGNVTCAYQFKEDETVDYYENDVLIETFPYYTGDYAVGFGGSVHCFSRDKIALFVDNNIFTLGGIEYEIPTIFVE